MMAVCLPKGFGERVVLWGLLGWSMLIGLPAEGAAPKLVVSPDKRFLQYEDGKPFFYLGDTAWELFHRLSLKEADEYLTDRANKGFTVIQAVALAELDGLRTPNPQGHLPLENDDPTRPVEAYFQDMDQVINRAEELGMFVGLLPTWGDKWTSLQGGAGPCIFNTENAEVFGEFLGRRYRDKPIIWILGGDRTPETEEHRAIMDAMAKGIERGSGGHQLMTFHPRGAKSSSEWFHNADWLDFNMAQSSHGRPNAYNFTYILRDRDLVPTKPTLDGEPRYEDIPHRLKVENEHFDDWDVRQAAWWAILAGACGHTYGNNTIWQMAKGEGDGKFGSKISWRAAMQQPGAEDMGHMRRLMESRDWQKLVPDQQMIVGDAGEGADHIRAARASDGSFAILYNPTGRPFEVQLDRLHGGSIRGTWFDPRTGESQGIEAQLTGATHAFTSPSHGRGNDWVLLLDAGPQK